MHLLGGQPSAAAWLTVDWKWLEAAKSAKESPPTQEQVEELDAIRAAQKFALCLSWCRKFKQGCPPGATSDGPDLAHALATATGSSAMVALQSKPGPTNADLAEPFLQVCNVVFSKRPKFASKPEIVRQALQYQLFTLQQEYLNWGALRAVHRVPQPERPPLLNAILGDYQKFGLNSMPERELTQKSGARGPSSQLRPQRSRNLCLQKACRSFKDGVRQFCRLNARPRTQHQLLRPRSEQKGLGRGLQSQSGRRAASEMTFS